MSSTKQAAEPPTPGWLSTIGRETHVGGCIAGVSMHVVLAGFCTVKLVKHRESPHACAKARARRRVHACALAER